MTIREVFGPDLKGRKLVLHWVASARVDRTPTLPIAHLSLLSRLGLEVVVAHPEEYQLPASAIKEARSNARSDGARFEIVHTPQAALHHADIICAMNWAPPEALRRRVEAQSDEDRHSAEEHLTTLAARHRNWVIGDETLKHARPRAVHLHALPIERGVAVADSVLDGQQSVWIQQAANRLHVTKAVLAAILRDRPLGPAV
jgi:ornithine carbamoyltransferase